METRRNAIKLSLAGAIAVPMLARADAAPDRPCGAEPAQPLSAWARGIEGQRKADLGDGHYLNPILPGDYPDPTILKDGDDYYMTHSSFDASPGQLIWHSRDLVRHGDRYYIYIPFMRAPWSSGLAGFTNTTRLCETGCVARSCRDPGDARARGHRLIAFLRATSS